MNPKRISGLFCLFCTLLAVWAVQLAYGADGNPDLDDAIALYRAEGPETALPEFERLHALFESSGDRAAASQAERYIGESHWRLGNYEQSRAYLNRALALMRELGQRLEVGKTLNVMGLLEWTLGNYELAIDYFAQASAIGSELGDKRLAGSTMNNLSLVYDELGDYQTSLKQYNQALELYEGVDFPRGVSDTLGNIGGVNLLLGRYREALAYYQRALTISESLESRALMSLDHGNLALCYLGLGQPDQALEHFDQALQLARQAGMDKEEALWLRGRGNALIRKGQHGLGLESHRAALEIHERLGARGLFLDSLHDIGQLHLTLGDPVSAEQYFQRAIQMAREIGQTQAITVNLLALGDLRVSQEQLEEAGALFHQALQRATEADELNYRSESLLRLSLVYRKQGRYSEAKSVARRALSLALHNGARFVQAQAWFAIAESARLQEHFDQAFEYYDAAQNVSGVSTDPETLWRVHYGRAWALIESARRQEAIDELEAAVGIIESVRTRLREERFKSGYVQDKYQVYTDLVRLQLELGMTQKAFSTAERLRSRSFLDQLENNGSVSRNHLEREEEIALRERVRQLRKALAAEQEFPPAEQRQLAVDTFSEELLAAERDYQAFLDDINGRATKGSAFRTPSLAEIQSRLRLGEALLQYVVGADRLMIFVLTPEKLSARSVSLDSINLSAKINLVRELILDPSSDSWWSPAASLSDSLIRPLQDGNLLEGIYHLYIVPHGSLNFLPFAILPIDSENDGRLLIERFTFNYLPAAATLMREPESGSVFNSLLAVAPARSKLRFALEEARSISGLYEPDSLLLIGAGATESAFKAQSGQFRVLHLSTHGYFNATNPLLSGLELEPDEANDGLLEVHEILDLSLDAELVTLSACETGMGSGYFNETPAGDDFVGMTRAFLLAGSRSVLATLWQVDDRSTVELMEAFYERLHQDDAANSQADALTQVQRKLRQSVKYKHPFFWAAFVLVGQHNRNTGA